MMYVGIDQSPRGTAAVALGEFGGVESRIFWADSKTAAERLRSFGAIEPTAVGGPADHLGHVRRLDAVRRHLGRWLAHVATGVETWVAMENYSMSSAPVAAREMGEVGGVVRCVVYVLGRPLRLYEVEDVKMFATGSFKAEKADVIRAVREKWDVDYAPFGRTEGAAGNLADAHVMAKMLSTEVRLRSGEVVPGELPVEELRAIERTTAKRKPWPYHEAPWILRKGASV